MIDISINPKTQQNPMLNWNYGFKKEKSLSYKTVSVVEGSLNIFWVNLI